MMHNCNIIGSNREELKRKGAETYAYPKLWINHQELQMLKCVLVAQQITQLKTQIGK